MNTTERIVEAVKKAAHTRNYITGISIDSEALYDAIASVIGKEQVKRIDLNEVENLIKYHCIVRLLPNLKDADEFTAKWRTRIGYTLSDLTPKTQEDEE
jgi:hypothetical protein